jgi:hypothetical protein
MSATLVASPEGNGSVQRATNVPRAFRLRRAPALEPPFDDERGIDEAFASWAPPGTTRSTLAVLSGGRDTRVTAPQPYGAAAHAASRYVQVCLEVLNGFRPPSHLRTLAGPIEFADVLHQLRSRRGPGGRGDGAAAAAANSRVMSSGGRSAAHPARPTMAPPNRGPAHVAFRLLRLRVSEPAPDKAEVAAVIAHAGASIAIAMRLEVRKATWVCTVLQVV